MTNNNFELKIITHAEALSNKENWSSNLQKMTYDVIDSVQVPSFSLNSRCHLKNFHTKRFKYGFITLSDALSGNFMVHDRESVNALQYESIEDMIADGWAVD